MSAITSAIEGVLRYYDTTRQCGHTTATMEGASRVNCVVVAHNHEGARFLKEEHHAGGKYVTLTEIANGGLRGWEPLPLVFDNAALYNLLTEALNEIRHHETAQSELRKRVVKFLDEIDATVGRA